LKPTFEPKLQNLILKYIHNYICVYDKSTFEPIPILEPKLDNLSNSIDIHIVYVAKDKIVKLYDSGLKIFSIEIINVHIANTIVIFSITDIKINIF